MIGSDIVRGMIKLYLNGYLSYDEIVDWASRKYNNSEFVVDASDDRSESLFDVLSLMTEGRSTEHRLDVYDFHDFLARLDAEGELSPYD
ncbi:MAG: hypothetical protein IBX71_08990 [Candidatus Desulforudis sp.]|nr:hypothetical protein [Desulforudis sp.]